MQPGNVMVEGTEVRFKLRSNFMLTEQTVEDFMAMLHNHCILLCVTLELLFECCNNNSEVEFIRYPLPTYFYNYQTSIFGIHLRNHNLHSP